MSGIKFSKFDGKSYYYNSIKSFLGDNPTSVLGTLITKSFNCNEDQKNAWINQIAQLQNKLDILECSGDIIFEYDITRLGKRIDVILLIKHIVFSLEYKNGEKIYKARDAEQAEDYALNLKNFHKESENLYVCPILIATEAEKFTKNKLETYEDKQIFLQRANKDTLISIIKEVCQKYGEEKTINFDQWYNSQYCPTPTIIEAATETYLNHTDQNIAQSEAGQEGINLCEIEVQNIIDYAKKNRKKCLCFITGVPGAGKTLVGLNIAAKNLSSETNDTKSVYISGNEPLITVLRESLTKNAIERHDKQNNLSRKEFREKTRLAVSAFIQQAHAFRKDMIINETKVPIENILIFDEAQRCWSKEKLGTWVKNKIKKEIHISEPEHFVNCMDKRNDWAVIICLVGLGQDIYDGEIGINEWFRSVIINHPDWNIYYSNKIFNQIEDKNIDKVLIEKFQNAHVIDSLHLPISIRSFRSELVSSFIDNLLDFQKDKALEIYNKINKYDIYVTRDLSKAKNWVRNKVRGSERCGLLACSSAQRLKPEGVFVNTEIDVKNWFLAPKEDLRSSNALEIAASEFKVQGLEIDYSIVCWDADLRKVTNSWEYYNFKGTKWQKRNKIEQQRYLLNAYRVLLTRARQGMVIFVPKGCKSEEDSTRNSDYYDETFKYLLSCGIKEL